MAKPYSWPPEPHRSSVQSVDVNRYEIVCSDCGYLFRYTDTNALAGDESRDSCPECQGSDRKVLVEAHAGMDTGVVTETEHLDKGDTAPDL